MENDDLNRIDLIRQLEPIRDKIGRLAQRPNDAPNLQNELWIQHLRLYQLILELMKSDSSKVPVSMVRVILVVDDNKELRCFIRQALELMDYIVLDSGDGDEAMEVIKNVPFVDLILCDVVLPGGKGPKIVKKIKEVSREIKVIFMSAYTSEDLVSQDVEQIVASGRNFIEKPFTTRVLLDTVQRVLEN